MEPCEPGSRLDARSRWDARSLEKVVEMARITIPIVEVTTTDGTKSFWAAYSVPHSNAVAAVRQKIPAEYTSELSLVRLPRHWAPDGLIPGEVFELDFDFVSSLSSHVQL
jgi:hypothetical protein